MRRCLPNRKKWWPTMCDEPVVLTVMEASVLLRISRGSCYEAVRLGQIPSVRIGRRILIPRQPLLDAITRMSPDGPRDLRPS